MFPPYIAKTQSRVLLAGNYGPLFTITWSITQRCPLAPFLVLFFDEAMISFLNVDNIGLRRLYIPFSNAELREAEFANETTLYLRGDLDNLHKTELALTIGTNPWHFGLGMKTHHYGICTRNFVGSCEVPQFDI